MDDPSRAAPITAIVYRTGARVDTLMEMIATLLSSRGVAVAGFIQVNRERPGRSRCDMVLKEIASTTCVELSEDRGPMARGCMLDVGQLMQATALATAALEARPDVLMVNKYGKTEAEGGGFRPLIADAVSRGTSVIIAVPASNLDSWRCFAGELAREVDADALANAVGPSLQDRLGLDVGSLGRGVDTSVEPGPVGITKRGFYP